MGPARPRHDDEGRGGLSPEGRIVDWSYDVWSNSHAMRPGQAGGVNLLAAWDLKVPFDRSPAPRIPQPFGDGDRNALPPYEFPRKEIRNHLLLDTPIRNGSFRTLGAHGNVFAIESFMDELAEAAGLDPVAFRLAHLKDPRARAVIEAAAATAGWNAGAKGDGRRGRGFAYSRYKTIGLYAAVVVDVNIDRNSGIVRVPRVVIAADIGSVVNPDGARNQLEGGIVQAVSVTGLAGADFSSTGERLRSCDRTPASITSHDTRTRESRSRLSHLWYSRCSSSVRSTLDRPAAPGELPQISQLCSNRFVGSLSSTIPRLPYNR